MLAIDLVLVIQGINKSFGKGKIVSITLNLKDSNPQLGEWYGTAKRHFPGGEDDRMFKIRDGFVIFLSHKRKVG